MKDRIMRSEKSVKVSDSSCLESYQAIFDHDNCHWGLVLHPSYLHVPISHLPSLEAKRRLFQKAHPWWSSVGREYVKYGGPVDGQRCCMENGEVKCVGQDLSLMMGLIVPNE